MLIQIMARAGVSAISQRLSETLFTGQPLQRPLSEPLQPQKGHRRIAEHSAMTISKAASGPARARGLSCDEPPTKLKVRVGGPGPARAASRGRRVGEQGDPGPAPEADKAAPSGRRRRRRRAVCPPCRAAPTSAVCTPPRARTVTRRAGRGGRRCRAATHPRASGPNFGCR